MAEAELTESEQEVIGEQQPTETVFDIIKAGLVGGVIFGGMAGLAHNSIEAGVFYFVFFPTFIIGMQAIWMRVTHGEWFPGVVWTDGDFR